MIRGGGECAVLAATLLSALFWPTAAEAQAVAFDIPSQPMAAALNAWAVQANAQVFVDPGPVAQLTAPAVRGTLTPRQALRALLARSNLQVTQGTDGVFVIKPRTIATVITPPPEAPESTAAPVTPPPPEPLTARASAGPWLIGLGAEFDHDHGGATVGGAALAGEYFITDRLAAALSATTPRSHSFEVPATATAANSLGSARLQTTALTLKYYVAPERRLDPFLGAGVALTTLWDASPGAGPDRVRADPTVEGGVDVLFNAHWMINGGVSWTHSRIDPVQFGLGFVYRFGASGDFLKRR